MSIAVVHPNDPNRPWVIPADQYDPAIHTLWAERHAVPEPVDEPDDDGWDDFDDDEDADNGG